MNRIDLFRPEYQEKLPHDLQTLFSFDSAPWDPGEIFRTPFQVVEQFTDPLCDSSKKRFSVLLFPETPYVIILTQLRKRDAVDDGDADSISGEIFAVKDGEDIKAFALAVSGELRRTFVFGCFSSMRDVINRHPEDLFAALLSTLDPKALRALSVMLRISA